jgi:hypothetical protein
MALPVTLLASLPLTLLRLLKLSSFGCRRHSN